MLFLTTFFLILKCLLGVLVALISIAVSILTAFLVEEFISDKTHQILGLFLGAIVLIIISSILLTLWYLYGMNFFFGA